MNYLKNIQTFLVIIIPFLSIGQDLTYVPYDMVVQESLIIK